MSNSKRVYFAMGVSWISKGLSILAALLLVPALFRFMSKEELGIWYLIGNSQAFVGLFGFGLAPVLTRHIALLVKSSHLDAGAVPRGYEPRDLDDLLFTGRLALRWMAIATMLVSWTTGYFVIRTLPLGHLSWTTVLTSWTVMCLGWSLQVWMSYLDCWIAGIGYVGLDTVITMGIAFAQTIAYILAAGVWHGGLLSLSWISLASVVVQRFVMTLFLRRRGIWRHHLPGVWSPTLATRLAYPSLKYWGTAVGAFLIYKTDQYFIAVFIGTAAVALYQSTYSTVMSLALGAGAATSSIVVFASQLWSEDKMEDLHALLIRGCKIGFFILICGELFLASAGRDFFQLWLKGSFIGYPILTILLLTLALDTQHGLLTNISRATDDEAYVISALTSGVLNLFCTYFLIKRLGMIGVPLGTLFAQLLTNNWYGVYRPLVRLRLSRRVYLKKVICPVSFFALLATAFTFAVRFLIGTIFGHSHMSVCLSAAVSSSVAGLCGITYILKGNALPLPWNRDTSLDNGANG